MLFLQNKISHTMTGFIQYKQTDTHRLYKADAIAWVYNNIRERKNQLSSYVTVSFCNSHFRFFFIGMLSFFALAKRDFAIFFSYLLIGKMQKRAENLREAVVRYETLPQNCENLLYGTKPSRKLASLFRSLRINN